MDFDKILAAFRKFVTAINNFLGKIGVEGESTYTDAVADFFAEIKGIADEF